MTSIPIGAAQSATTTSPTPALRLARNFAVTVAKALCVWLAYVVLLVALLFAGVPAVAACAVGVGMVMAAAWRLGWLARD